VENRETTSVKIVSLLSSRALIVFHFLKSLF